MMSTFKLMMSGSAGQTEAGWPYLPLKVSKLYTALNPLNCGFLLFSQCDNSFLLWVELNCTFSFGGSRSIQTCNSSKSVDALALMKSSYLLGFSTSRMLKKQKLSFCGCPWPQLDFNHSTQTKLRFSYTCDEAEKRYRQLNHLTC